MTRHTIQASDKTHQTPERDRQPGRGIIAKSSAVSKSKQLPPPTLAKPKAVAGPTSKCLPSTPRQENPPGGPCVTVSAENLYKSFSQKNNINTSSELIRNLQTKFGTLNSAGTPSGLSTKSLPTVRILGKPPSGAHLRSFSSPSEPNKSSLDFYSKSLPNSPTSNADINSRSSGSVGGSSSAHSQTDIPRFLPNTSNQPNSAPVSGSRPKFYPVLTPHSAPISNSLSRSTENELISSEKTFTQSPWNGKQFGASPTLVSTKSPECFHEDSPDSLVPATKVPSVIDTKFVPTRTTPQQENLFCEISPFPVQLAAVDCLLSKYDNNVETEPKVAKPPSSGTSDQINSKVLTKNLKSNTKFRSPSQPFVSSPSLPGRSVDRDTTNSGGKFLCEKENADSRLSSEASKNPSDNRYEKNSDDNNYKSSLSNGHPLKSCLQRNDLTEKPKLLQDQVFSKPTKTFSPPTLKKSSISYQQPVDEGPVWVSRIPSKCTKVSHTVDDEDFAFSSNLNSSKVKPVYLSGLESVANFDADKSFSTATLSTQSSCGTDKHSRNDSLSTNSSEGEKSFSIKDTSSARGSFEGEKCFTKDTKTTRCSFEGEKVLSRNSSSQQSLNSNKGPKSSSTSLESGKLKDLASVSPEEDLQISESELAKHTLNMYLNQGPSFHDYDEVANEEGLSQLHKKMKAAREEEQRQAAAEQQRLEDIMNMCADYEQQQVVKPNKIKTNGSLSKLPDTKDIEETASSKPRVTFAEEPKHIGYVNWQSKAELRQKLLDIEMQEDELIRELELERALLEGEHQSQAEAMNHSEELLKLSKEEHQSLLSEYHEVRAQKEAESLHADACEDLDFQLLELQAGYEERLEHLSQRVQQHQTVLRQQRSAWRLRLQQLQQQLEQLQKECQKLRQQRQQLLSTSADDDECYTPPTQRKLTDKLDELTTYRLSMLQWDPQASMAYGDSDTTQSVSSMEDDVVLRSAGGERQARPLTRYLPIRGDADFDLRTHVENCGHNLELCPEVLLDATTCQGMLHKQTSRLKNWNKRWFVFDRQAKLFTYFNERGNSKSRGSIPFSALIDVYVEHGVKGPGHAFCVKSKQRTLCLAAASPQAMRVWVDVLISGAEGYREFL